MQRVQQLSNQFPTGLSLPSPSSINTMHSTAGQKNPDDVVIVCAVRTPLTRARRGGLAQTFHEEMLAHVLKAVLERTRINPSLIEDVQVGNVLPPGGGATLARMAQLFAGYPDTSSISTVNRQCSSGLQACATIVSAIQTGIIEIGIGAGVESMTLNYGPGAVPSNMSETVLSFPAAADCLIPMGMTSENVAEKFGVSRAKQDAFAASSHQKAAKAQQEVIS
jgi:acetyl-CoA acyltransferase 1